MRVLGWEMGMGMDQLAVAWKEDRLLVEAMTELDFLRYTSRINIYEVPSFNFLLLLFSHMLSPHLSSLPAVRHGPHIYLISHRKRSAHHSFSSHIVSETLG